MFFTSSSGWSAKDAVSKVHPESATLLIDRVDFSFHSAPVVMRSFRRLEKNRGLFGLGWCSNVDLTLNGVEGEKPNVLELYDCLRGQTRTFNKLLEAWVEEGSVSRILRKADGRWELTESPYATFRPDGKLESFVSEGGTKWFVRRDSNGRPEGVDNLKSPSIKFRRDLAGDLDAIVGARDAVIIKYKFETFLSAAQAGDLTEQYQYDSQGNVLRLIRKGSAGPSKIWKFSYTTPEWVSTSQTPDGCKSQWLFDRTGLNQDGTRATALKESKVCLKAGETAPLAVSSAQSNGRVKTVNKPGPMGVGSENADVTVNGDGHPVLFEVVGEGKKTRRIEIERDPKTGAPLTVRSQGVEVGLSKKSSTLGARQLELLDDYEAWLSAWGASRGSPSLEGKR